MRDTIHNAVKSALEKEGWQISADPLYLPLEGTTIEIDLEAEKIDLTSSTVKIIFVEIKSIRKSVVYEFYNAFGQYVFYKEALASKGVAHPLFLAISSDAYRRLGEIPLLENWLRKNKVKLLIVDIEHQSIEKWIEA